MNLWGISKKCGDVVVIKTNDNKEFIISKDKISSIEGNLISNFIDFKVKTSNETNKISNAVIYDEKNYNAEQLNIIYRIFNRCYITINEYENNLEIIDYYCIDPENILIDELNSNKKIIDTELTQNFSDNIILCDTEEKLKYLNEFIVKHEMPFISFKLILCEGCMSYGGEMSGTPPQFLKMCPVFLSVCDYNNIGFISKLKTTNTNIKNNITEILVENNFNVSDEEDFYDNKYVALFERMNLDLGLPEIIKKNLFNRRKFSEFINTDLKDEIQETEFYSINMKNKKNFVGTTEQVDLLIGRLNEINFQNETIELMKKANWNFPQKKENFHENFCNEDVYANLNLITVFGLIRMN